MAISTQLSNALPLVLGNQTIGTELDNYLTSLQASFGSSGAANLHWLTWNFSGANTATIYDLFVAPAALTVKAITATVSVALGSTATGCLVQAADGATPSTSTTPLQSSLTGINFNGTAYTLQTVGLSATGANLVLAATAHIALVLSTALTANHAFSVQVGFTWN